jgi:hypothetical protein
VKRLFSAHIEIHGHPYLCLVVSQSSTSTNKWGQNQLVNYKKFAKQQYHEELWIMKIIPCNYLPTTFIQSTNGKTYRKKWNEREGKMHNLIT